MQIKEYVSIATKTGIGKETAQNTLQRRGIHICYAKLENNLYILKLSETKAILNTVMFKTAETQNKQQKISPNTYL